MKIMKKRKQTYITVLGNEYLMYYGANIQITLIEGIPDRYTIYRSISFIYQQHHRHYQMKYIHLNQLYMY